MDFPDNMTQTRGTTPRTRATHTRYIYEIDRLSEGTLSTLLFGRASINTTRLQDLVNKRSALGYRMVFQVLEQRRTLLFFRRESIILTFEKPIS